MASLFERVASVVEESAEYGDSLAESRLGRTLRAVLAPHEPEQHYTRGQDGKSSPSYLYCRACRKTSPCPPLLLAAAELGLNAEEVS